MKPLVYIETTIPSYYCDDRPAVAADIARTREWWDDERDTYDCYISAVVLDELGSGDYPNKEKCLALVQGLPALEVNQDVLEIARVYQARRLNATAAGPGCRSSGRCVLLPDRFLANLELPAHRQRQQGKAP